jgi:hypothetical protein
MSREKNGIDDRDRRESRRLASYVKPKLIEYGQVEKLTQGGTSGNPEIGGKTLAYDRKRK